MCGRNVIAITAAARWPGQGHLRHEGPGLDGQIKAPQRFAQPEVKAAQSVRHLARHQNRDSSLPNVEVIEAQRYGFGRNGEAAFTLRQAFSRNVADELDREVQVYRQARAVHPRANALLRAKQSLTSKQLRPATAR